MRTGLYTSLTAHTLLASVKFLWLWGTALRIMTPHTRERASFHKQRNPDARPIIDRIAFDIKQPHTLETLLLGTRDHVSLQVSIHVVEIITVTSHSHQQVAILLRTTLRGMQSLCIHQIELDVMTP